MMNTKMVNLLKKMRRNTGRLNATHIIEENIDLSDHDTEDTDKTYFELDPLTTSHKLQPIQMSVLPHQLLHWTLCPLICKLLTLNPPAILPQREIPTPQSQTPRKETAFLLCPYEGCGKKFSGKDHLKRHEVSHNDLKMKCIQPDCEKLFRDTAVMRRRHHSAIHQKLLYGVVALKTARRPSSTSST